MSTSELAVAGGTSSPRREEPRRLLVTRQDENRMYRPVGFLDASPTDRGVMYTFSYLRAVVRQPGFHPLLGFGDLHGSYESLGLFPLFAERIMDPRRPDRAEFLAALDLGPDAGPLAILERSGGHRLGDGIELLPVPTTSPDGRIASTLLVHGVRHVPGAEHVVASLSTGDRLALVPQPDNVWNPRAITVAAREPERRIGWVPNAFVDVVHELTSPEVVVVRVNGPEVGPRYRLLVRVSGSVEPGWAPFTGQEWQTTLPAG